MEEIDREFMGEVVNFVHDDLIAKGFPEEVAWVIMMQMYCPLVGSATMDKIIDIKNRYPKYYPWEAKYNSIPKEVHDAYNEERWEKSGWNQAINRDGGLESEVNRGAMEYKELTMKDWNDALINMERADKERIKEEKLQRDKDKRLWDKHYRKYGLSFRD